METFVNNAKQLAARVKEAWAKLSLNQKVLFGGVALLIVAALVTLTVSSSNQGTPYDVLYTELDKKDAAQIVAKLDEAKTPYELQNDGTTILVPPEVKDKTRLQLASENLPRGETGFELFQETNFGETQTDKKVKYQMALQGELARTIQGLDKVKAAKVNLALPEETLFSDNEELPKASVVVNTKDNEKLTPKEIQGIINLVANSVDKLTKENVVIVDQNGNLVSDIDNQPNETIDVTEMMKFQMEMKKQYEKEKQEAIQSMLDQSLGKNNSVVRVNVELDFNDKEQKAEQYTHDPDGPFIRSEELKKESGTNTTTANTAVPGTDTNIPQYQEANNQNGVSSYDKSSTIRNYEINKTETTTKLSQGDVKYDYLTVAVLVNSRGTEQAKLGDTEEAKVEKIRNIVATACGLRENRNNETVKLEDNISVAFVDFVTKPAPAQATGTMDKILESPLTPWLMALLIIAIALLVWALMKRRERLILRAKQEEAEQPEFEEIVGEEIKVEDLIDAGLSPEEKERRRIREEIDRIISEEPEIAAQVLKTWLAED
ncbi:MAG: flagellar basal-body MS-ring/collar protein FliF [Syntrophomonas sp.]